MTILDANVLLYAYFTESPHHEPARAWLRHLFAGEETIGLPWVTLWAFIRISTNLRAWSFPMPTAKVFEIIRDWLTKPGVVIVNPGPRHPELLERLISEGRAAGPLVTDAALAALAIENGAVLASTDRDFSRFPGLRWVNPAP